MNVNIKISMSDEDRNIMAMNLTGKISKRMVTRAEISSFVQGCLDSITDSINIGEPLETVKVGYIDTNAPKPMTDWFTEIERSTVEGLRAMGRDDSYIRGWLQVGRRQ
jgi:hypothetical protein